MRLALDEPDDELLRAVYEGAEPDDRDVVPVREGIRCALEEDPTEWNRHVGRTKVQGDE